MDRQDALFASLQSVIGNAQFAIIAATVVVVVAGVVLGLRWYVNRSNGGHARGVVTDALAVISPYLAGLAIVGTARLSLAADGEPTSWLDTAWTLLALLALIRLLIFLLRLSLGRSTRIKAWELRTTLIVWALIATQL
ncbi:MAG: hypothetical protein ACRETI_09925, partial [Steroidobacteraceae bacterium]